MFDKVVIAVLATIIGAWLFCAGWLAHGTQDDVIVDKDQIFCNWNMELYDGKTDVCVDRTDHSAHEGH